jgi:hypothetical protein
MGGANGRTLGMEGALVAALKRSGGGGGWGAGGTSAGSVNARGEAGTGAPA